MTKVSTNISLDADIKEQAMEMLNDFGLDLSTIVGMMLRQMLRENRIPFEVKREVPNAVTMKAIENANEEMDMVGPFTSVASLMEALNA